jgi:hypothetical protein
MQHIPDPIYQTPDELDERIRLREADAAMTSPGEPLQSILKEIMQLRMYADAKRWIESPGLKPGH